MKSCRTIRAGLMTIFMGMTPAYPGGDDAKMACRNALHDVDRAIPACTLVIDDPTESTTEKVAARVSRARAYFSKRDWPQAIIDYNAAIPLLPAAVAPYNERAVAHDRSGDRDLAMADYSRAIDLDPANFLAYNNRGLLHYKNGSVDLSITDLNEAIRLNPRASIAYNGRGVALSSKGDYLKAIDDFSEALRLNRFFANAFNNRGVAHTKLGNFDQAIQDLTAALRLKDSADFSRELASTFLAAGRAADALPYADRAIRKDPAFAGAYDTRGSIYESLGQRDLAAVDFEAALSLDPKIVSSAAALARLGTDSLPWVPFTKVVQFVEREGWRINLSDLCGKLGLPHSDADCVFQQLSVEDTTETSYPRGFNVATASKDGRTSILLFHLNPLIGEFFIVAPDGTLAEAYLRSKGSEYERVPNQVMREEFEKDVVYWRKNFFRLKAGLALGRPVK
jgi:tetratricopeptide (TPR) repeat protein